MTKRTKKKASSRKKSSRAKKSPAADFRAVRQQVKNVVCDKASAIATAVAEEVGNKAQVASMKTLFELVGLFPESAEEREAAGDDQALAKILLERMGLSDAPAVNEEEARERQELEESARALMKAPAHPVE
jgi:hypothetical protein